MIDWRISPDFEADGARGWGFSSWDMQEYLLPQLNVGLAYIDEYDDTAFSTEDCRRLLGNIDYLLGCGPFRKWPTVSFDTWERQGATLLSADIVDCLNKLKEAAELAVQRGGSLVFFGD